jgi:Protein of unknown function (Hypoth_ymh)
MDWGRAEKVVEEFVALIDAHQEAACDPGQARVAEKLQEQIRMRLPTIAVIGDQVLRNFGAGLQEAHVGYCWQPIRDRSLTLFGYLRDAEERDAILGPVGPRLSASELHTTVWSAAARLYDGEHYRAAVQAAASAVEMQLKAKLDRYDLSGDPLVTEAFSIAPPQPGKPRLRFTGVGPPAGSLWRDAHVGAMNFGKGCMMGIRNVVSHDTSEPQPEIALEQLAALSILARWIDAASLQTAQAPTQPR